MKKPFRTNLIISALFFLVGNTVHAVDVNAQLDWSDKRNLGTTISGKVDKVNVHPGANVQVGDVLVELDARYFKVKQMQAKARMQHTKLQMEEAQREQERAIELFDRTVLSVFDRQQADIQLASAQATHADARADFEMAKLDMEYSKIISPYSGIVLTVNVSPGEVVVNKDEVTTLIQVARADEMIARATVSADLLSKLKIGQSLDVAFRGQWQKGIVHNIRHLSGVSAGNAAQYSVEVKLPVEVDVGARAGEASAIRIAD